MDQEVYENVVASLVDIGSIFAAYLLGLHQLGIQYGLLYALFDAWLVVWMRKPLSRSIKQALSPLASRSGTGWLPAGYRPSASRSLMVPAMHRKRRGLVRLRG
jgi:hypothetical protein